MRDNAFWIIILIAEIFYIKRYFVPTNSKQMFEPFQIYKAWT